MTATILRADARHLPLPDASVDLIVTSPPYFALRSYSDTCNICLALRRDGRDPAVVIVGYDKHVREQHHYDGQIGAEPTPAEYIAALLESTREWVRVLKPSGSIFVNLGDKYAGGGGQWEKDDRPDPHKRRAASGKIGTGGKTYGLKPKSLLMLPERYRIAAVDQLGLIARAVIVWAKLNGLPESVTDRVRRSHEDWVHLTKQPRYFAAIDEIREPASGYARTRNATRNSPPPPGNRPRTMADTCNPLGKLPGSVWDVATEPLKVPAHLGVDHFAAFPTEWPRRIIQGWSPSGICTACGEGRRPVSERTVVFDKARDQAHATDIAQRAVSRTTGSGGTACSTLNGRTTRAITGEACACPDTSAPTRPAVVLDPFGGTGTTSLVASVLGRHGISVDMSADYCRLARWRTTDRAQRAKAARVPAPPKVHEDQGDLFGELAT